MSRRSRYGALTRLLLFAAFGVPIALGCEHPDAGGFASSKAVLVATGSATVIARTPVIATYPCSRCHDERRPPNSTKRKLRELHVIALNHGATPRWCYQCHSIDDPDRLVLPDGMRISFDESYKLCGSCHGEVAQDWRRGIHGLTTGFWNGNKQRRNCTSCHSPHTPAFAPMAPLRAPSRPRYGSSPTPKGH